MRVPSQDKEGKACAVPSVCALSWVHSQASDDVPKQEAAA